MEFSFHLVAALPRICILYAHIILYYTGNLGESYGVDPIGCALVAFETKSSMLFLNLLRTFNLRLSARINNIQMEIIGLKFNIMSKFNKCVSCALCLCTIDYGIIRDYYDIVLVITGIGA